MLLRDERIGTTDFRRAFDGRQVVRGKSLQARFSRRDDDKATTRAAFVVTKKTGKAVVRNRLRRRLREIYRLSEWRRDARLTHLDLLIFAGNSALSQSNDALKKELSELLERVAKTARRGGNEKTRGESRQNVSVAPLQTARQPVHRFVARATAAATAAATAVNLASHSPQVEVGNS